MNYDLIGIAAAATIAVGLFAYFTSTGIQTVGEAVLSYDEIKAASAIVTLRNPPYNGNVEAFLVDTPGGDIIPEARAMAKQYPAMTWVEKNRNEGIRLALRMKAAGLKIEMPELTLKPGYHITRWNGSAALVKDGDPEPVFGCIEGYRPTGNRCIK